MMSNGYSYEEAFQKTAEKEQYFTEIKITSSKNTFVELKEIMETSYS